MLYATTPAAEKRRLFRERLATGEIMRFPGAFNPLSARLIGEKGFEGVYISGAVLSADLGLPDIGLTTLTEVAGRGRQIARMTELPAIIDADTGFGEPMNVARTVQEMEDAGLAGLHIEDQVNPKRCGHLDGKQVVDDETALRRIRAAVDARRDPNFLVMARTDIAAVDGLQAAVDRAKALVDAGADAIFPEAMRSLEEFEAIRAAVDVPLLANMTEFGKSELFTVQQLADVGMNIVIWPVSLLRLAMGAAVRGLDELEASGSLTAKLDDMQHRADLYELIDYEGYNHFDTTIFNFTVARRRSSSAQRASRPDKQGSTHGRAEHRRAARVRGTDPADLQGPGRCAGRLHRRLEGQPRHELAAVPRVPRAGARRVVHLRGGRLPALARRAARRRRARGVRGTRAVAARPRPRRQAHHRRAAAHGAPDGRRAHGRRR